MHQDSSDDSQGKAAGPPGPLKHAVVALLADQHRALHVAEIATRLGVRDRGALSEALDDLTGDGVVIPHAGRRYRIAPGARIEREEIVEGIVHVNPRGFAFVRVAGAPDDLYVPGEAIGGAMHGDGVRARVVARTRRGREGEIVEVRQRARQRVVGVLRGRPGQRRLEPDDARIRGPIEIVDESAVILRSGRGQEAHPAAAGLVAMVELVRYPEHAGESPRGRLAIVLGAPGDPDVEVDKVLVGHGIDERHPADAEQEASAFGEDPSAADLEGREDLRHLPFLAIDPEDARDHDDAVWVERDDQGRYRAWVAIADVSHYVVDDSALDRSARERGCSVYLPDRAVPMLPPNLSSRLCSLLPDRERLCLCVELALDAEAAVVRTKVHVARMRARAFLTYQAVARALGFTSEPARDPEAEALRGELRVMWDLASLLRRRRMRRGALDLDVPEARVQIDSASRAPIAVSQRSIDPGVKKAYRLIEELMLLANEAMARLALSRAIPMIFRVHGAPDPDKLARFALQCAALGVELDAGDGELGIEPKQLNKFLRKIAGHQSEQVIHSLMLRALQQAAYDTVNIGHFGLASSAYLHFTSPIRRYPDLVVHRMIKRALAGAGIGKDDALEAALRDAALTASQRERNAMETEREIADVYRALYMRSRIGDVLEGRVAAVTPTGVYLRVAEPFVDVLVPLDALGSDAYEPDELGLEAVGMRSGDTVRLGDSMHVVIEDVSIERRAVFGRRVAAERERRRKAKGGGKGRRGEKGSSSAARGRKQRRETGKGGPGRRRGR